MKKKLRHTNIGNVKVMKDDGIFAVVEMQADVKSESEISYIVQVVGARFLEERIGLQINSDVIQHVVSQLTNTGGSCEKFDGQEAHNYRMEFMFVNGIGVDKETFTDKVNDVFRLIVSEFEGITVKIDFMNSDSIIMERNDS